MLVLVIKIESRSTTPKKGFPVPSYLGSHSRTGLRENGYWPVKKREFVNSTLTTPSTSYKANYYKKKSLTYLGFIDENRVLSSHLHHR